MKTRTMVSIDKELKNEADEYIKTHANIQSFSSLVSLALKNYIYREENAQKKSKQDDVTMLLIKQSLLSWQNLCEDMFATCETSKNTKMNPQKILRWKTTMEQQQEVIDLFITPASIPNKESTPKELDTSVY